MRKFKRAQAQNQASIEKHLLVDTSPDSSSEDEKNQDSLLKAVTKVLSSYQGEGGDTEKSLSYLTDTFQSGGAICLICISSVKRTDPIWSCSTCFSLMHLSCVQHWIRDSLRYKREKGITPLWACPKCRMEHREEEIPKRYVCFCGQTTDPSYQPWAIPHSCGEKCDKPLRPACGHRCLLLCHPGACPPCPKMVRAGCFCGKEPAEARRCNAKEWSCGKICSKKFENCSHNCGKECHTGACPPCSVSFSVPCRCGAITEERACGEANWYCEKRCGNILPCKVHVCEGRCHRSSGGDCGECPSEKYCPCGKRRYLGVATCLDVVPTCGDTCGRLLDCGSHRCSMRCHPDRCGPCLEVVTKSCRCRSYEKEVACAKEFYCNKKCPQTRTCGKHTCNKKCCDCLLRDNSNVCEKICDRALNCQRHKCSAPCHSGPCYPCPRTNLLQCRCGNSKITVPCGRIKRRIKPPNCKKLCKIPPVCHHTKRESHKCHHGPCPPCRKTCSVINKKCAHPCPVMCHTNRPTSRGPSASRVTDSRIIDSRIRLKNFPCPPCELPVMTPCLGGHETTPLPCHRAISYSCQRPCGQLLGCTNHTCEILCHRVATLDDPSPDSCPECERPCAQPRPEGCPHPCPRFCHRGPCDPCNQLVKLSCHCGINSLYKRCARLTTSSSDERASLDCGNRCPKNYPCGHRCVENCHSGECPNAETCGKRVKVWCGCKRFRKDLSCVELRKGGVRVECDETCRGIQKKRERVGEMEAASKRREEEARNRMEVERFERKFKRRRGGRERMPSINSREDRDRPLKKFAAILGASVLLLLAIAVYYANKRYD